MTGRTLVFAGHDIASGEILLPILRRARAEGHRVSLLAAGPTDRLWRDAGEALVDDEQPLAAMSPDHRPALLVTGMSYHADFERLLWRAARVAGIRSLAFLDAWINFRPRLTLSDGSIIQPDAVGVIDVWSRQRFQRDTGFQGPLHTVGQPHLERLVAKLRPLRQRQIGGGRKLAVFFTEPVAQHLRGADYPGYDQFSALTALSNAMAGHPGIDLAVKVHPKDSASDWLRWLAASGLRDRCRLTEDGTPELLATADLVVGMTTMVLIEAGLLGVPTLSVQIERNRAVNPILDALPDITVVTKEGALAPTIARLLAHSAANGTGCPSLHRVLEGSEDRAFAAVERELSLHSSMS